MSKHTPGPWKMMYGKNTMIVTADETTIISTRIQFPRASAQTVEANEKLIAAAPDMAEALRDLYTECDAMQHEELDSDPVWGPIMRAAKAALAKAGFSGPIEDAGTSPSVCKMCLAIGEPCSTHAKAGL